jgi:hypothetical protein
MNNVNRRNFMQSFLGFAFIPTAVASVPSAGGLEIEPEYNHTSDGQRTQRGMIRLDAIAKRLDDRGATEAWPLYPKMISYYKWHINHNGQQFLDPIVVKRLHLDNVPFTHYEIVDGRQRCWACRELGLKTILAWVIL